MKKIFINIEGDNVCLYNLDISDKAKDLEKEILYNGPVKPMIIEAEFSPFSRGEILEEGVIASFDYEFLRKDGVKNFYKYTYKMHNKTQLYDDLVNIRLGHLEYLEDLNDYYSGKVSSDNSSDLFNKFKDDIMRFYRLELLYKENGRNTLQLLGQLITNSEGDYRDRLGELAKHLNVYQINLSNFDIIDLTDSTREVTEFKPIRYDTFRRVRKRDYKNKR